MANPQKIASTEVITSINPLVDEGRYYVFGNRKNPDKSAGLVIINGGYEIYKPTFTLKRNSVPYYVIEFPVSGRCLLQINKKEYTLEKGVVAGYKPGEPHYYRCDPANPLEHYFINISGRTADYFFRNTKIKSEYLVKLDEFEYFKKLMVNILKAAFNKNIYSFELCHSYLKVFLLELCHQPHALKQTDSISRSTYTQCIKYIDKNYLKIISVDNVADAMNITPRYIAKLFLKYDTTGAYKYITGLKMTRAAELLLTTMMPVKHIAVAVGYENQYHFSRVFKNFYGVSPIAYRKKYLSSL